MSRRNIENIEELWDERSRFFGDAENAVMEQSFPGQVNDVIHQIHCRQVLDHISRDKNICLDVGCGYGRLAIEVVSRLPRTYIYGVDISKTFVELFNRKLNNRGQAKKADVRNLPFKDNMFDVVWVVATLMYVEGRIEKQRAISEILRVLKPSGTLIVIEPNKLGNSIVKGWGLFPFIYRNLLRKKKMETFGCPFAWGDIDDLLKREEGIIVSKKGYPMLTVLLPLILGISVFSSDISCFLLTIAKSMDEKINIPKISYFISYIIKKL